MRAAMPIRILPVEDPEIVRRGLRAVLEAVPDIVVTDEAANGLDAVEKAERYKPNVVLMDIRMPELNGLEAAWWIRHKSPSVQLLYVVAHVDDRANPS
jgi:DNA-binding NarL/FixJ family response regulator